MASGIQMKYLVKELETEAQQKSHSSGRTVGHYMSTEEAENDGAQHNSLYIRPSEQ